MVDDDQGLSVPPLKERWFASMQNLAFEIEAARSDVLRITDLEGLPADAKEVVDRCGKLLRLVAEAFNRRSPRELFIWESLFQIRQDLLLVLPPEELLAKWEVVQTEITATQEKCNKFPWKKKWRDAITNQLTSSAGSAESERQIRSRIREIRKYLDDRVVLQLWRSIVVRRFGLLFALLAVAFGVLLAIAICAPGCLLGHCLPDNKSYTLFGVIVAGTLGSTLSALANIGHPGHQDGVPLLYVLQLVRPVVGAASGLFFYLVLQTKIIAMDGIEVYIFAIAFGFSELALFRVLQNLTGKIEADMGRGWR